jgi:hypothetical protein
MATNETETPAKNTRSHDTSTAAVISCSKEANMDVDSFAESMIARLIIRAQRI